MQNELKEKELEIIRKEEEIKDHKAKGKIIVRSAEDVKAANAAEVQRLRKQHATDTALHQNHIAKLVATHDQVKHEYKDKHKQAKRSLRAASQKIEDLEKELTHLRQSHDEYRNRAERAQTELTQTQTELTTAASANQENQRMKSEFALLQSERDDAVARATAAESRLGAYAEQVATLEAEVQLARQSHADLIGDHNELSAELEHARQALEEAQVRKLTTFTSTRRTLNSRNRCRS